MMLAHVNASETERFKEGDRDESLEVTFKLTISQSIKMSQQCRTAEKTTTLFKPGWETSKSTCEKEECLTVLNVHL